MLSALLQDDLSGRQWWTLTAAAGGGYTIQILTGREDCNPQATFLGTVACGANTVGMTTANAGNGLQTWTVTAIPTPPAPPLQPPFQQILPNGLYTLSNDGRPTCANLVNYDTCATGNGVFMNTIAGACFVCTLLL